MANENTIISSNASVHYILTFTNKVTAPAVNLEELTVKQGSEVMLAEGTNRYLLTLRNVKVSKKIYQPIEIEADLDFMQQTTKTETKAPTFKAVSDMLLQRQVELKAVINDTGDPITVAKNCYLYELKPQLKVDVRGTRMNVILSIFSMDKRMTLNKYSKAYVARKLGSGILKPESLEFGLKADKQSPIVETDTTSQINLMYAVNGMTSERIHPYLVQYNESFYDFLVRTTNRCGEFLYFEDGKLNLGLPTDIVEIEIDIPENERIVSTLVETPTKKKVKVKRDPVVINQYDSVVIQDVASDPLVVNDYVRDSMKDSSEVGELNHTVVEKLDNGFPEDAFPEHLSRNAELSNDEYNFPLANDKFSSLKREALYDKPIYKVMNGLKAITMGDKLVGSVIGLGVQEGLLAMGGNSQAGNTNKAMQKNNIEPYEEKTEQVRDGKVVQFTSFNEKGWTTNQFYNDIRQNETDLGRQIICIEMGTAYANVKLGQRIQIKGLDGNYIIIEIQTTSEEYAQGSVGKRQQTICAIPVLGEGNNETYYPPVQPVSVIRKSGPQTAFVTDNNDPKYQGRVRVAFPWQTLKGGLKKQLKETSTTLAQTTEEKNKLMSGMREVKLKVWNAIEKLDELITVVKSTAVEREAILAAKKAEIATLEKQIEKWTREKTMVEDRLNTFSTDPSQSDIRNEARKNRIQELELEIKSKEEKLASKKQELADIEAAIKEHDEKKDTPGYVVEKTNSVVKARWDACEKLYYEEYEASHEKIKKLEKDEEAQESQKEKIQKVLDKSIIDISTPWIRVATPMATPGGGAYFKPRVGDEVLINFDNDNVERPYVVGSLYSKNNLDPFESFERKGAPTMQFGTGKQVSMSIMSPNGHHITFSDPKDGNKFIYGLNPGTKFWLPFAPIPSIPNSKELAGGIHIGDRYGIYEIEMCSHDRYISIKSPLGTVDISAFTGITIKAPNGDVNIQGKNVNISAGNKVTITSGNNIEPPGIGDPDYRCGTPIWHSLKKAGWWAPLTFFANLGRGIRFGALYLGHQILTAAPTAVNNQLGPAAFADVSLIRHMFEVAVKPVDGTMLIKSKRYLKIEAGSGEAKIKADRFNDDKKIESLEVFYMQLNLVMKEFNNKITDFYSKYENFWNNAISLKMELSDILSIFLEESNLDEITKAYFKAKELDRSQMLDASEIYEDDELKEGAITYNGETYETNEQKRNFLHGKIIAYIEAVINLHVHATSFKTLLDYYPDDYMFGKAAKEAFKHFAEKEQEKWEDKYGVDEPSPDFIDWVEEVYTKAFSQTLLKRKTTALYLIKVSESDENKEGKFLSVGFDESDLTDRKVKSDYNWKNFMTHFDNKATHGNKALIYLFDGIVKPIKERWKNPIGVIKENKIWAADKGGQILFSDNDGATLHFEGEGLKSESLSNLGNRDQLMKTLLAIK